jgi:NAD(P)-dependent dehydrogenase (short-subunit alcohol dehydrogenase family)
MQIKRVILGFSRFLGGMLLIGFLASPLNSHAVTIVNEGPFTLSFYNNGETDGSGYTSAQNWTPEQINDVVLSVQTWSSVITDVPGRQVDVAGPVLFLLSSAARWMTGAVLVVDGGYSVG